MGVVICEAKMEEQMTDVTVGAKRAKTKHKEAEHQILNASERFL